VCSRSPQAAARIHQLVCFLPFPSSLFVLQPDPGTAGAFKRTLSSADPRAGFQTACFFWVTLWAGLDVYTWELCAYTGFLPLEGGVTTPPYLQGNKVRSVNISKSEMRKHVWSHSQNLNSPLAGPKVGYFTLDNISQVRKKCLILFTKKVSLKLRLWST
jgi:hypothetical protein